jgi:hypothetical protein
MGCKFLKKGCESLDENNVKGNAWDRPFACTWGETFCVIEARVIG